MHRPNSSVFAKASTDMPEFGYIQNFARSLTPQLFLGSDLELAGEGVEAGSGDGDGDGAGDLRVN